jgi:N-acetylglucosamine kinase-like BadF-type ATPase
MRALYLAIDGGNSKTDVVLGTAEGDVLASVRGGTSSPHNIGLAGTVSVLDQLVETARAQAGLPDDEPIDVAAAYLAGADLPAEVTELQTALSAQAWARRTIVDNDCFALLRSGTSMPDAVTVVCGAGNNCVGRRPMAVRPGSSPWARSPATGAADTTWPTTPCASRRGARTAGGVPPR